MKKINKNKKKLFYIIIILLLICLAIIIYKKMIKNKKYGNNMSSQQIVDYILNVSSYKSTISVQVNSNKNKNKYVIKQEYSENKSIQEIIEPLNIQGTKIIKENENLILENTKMNLSHIFENYKGLEENSLDLIAFIQDYKNNENSNFEENDLEIIMKTR